MAQRNGLFGGSARAICLLAGASFVIAACDRETDAGRRVRQASNEMIATTGGGTAPAADAVRDKTQKSVAGLVGGAAGEGTQAGERASAQLLMAESLYGQAAAPAARATEAEARARATMASITRLLDTWCTSSAVAGVAESFDPSAQVAEIGAAKIALDTQASDAEKEKQAIEARVAELRGRAKSRLDAAGAKMASYEAEMARTVRMSATDAAPVVRAANVLRREADALRLEGEGINAEADSIAPTIAAAALRADQVRNQRANLERIEAELARRKSEAEREAGEARTAATVAGNEIDRLAGDLEKQVREVRDEIRRAVDLYGQSFAKAQSATNDSPTTARLSQATAQQALAGMYLQEAQLLQVYAGQLEILGNATPKVPAIEPPLPQASAYAAAAREAREQAKAALESAASKYEGAISAFQGVRTQGDAKEKLEQVAASLKRALDRAQGKGLDAEVEARIGDAALAQALADIVAAARERRYTDLLAFIDAPPEVVPFLQASFKVDQACLAKFGKSLTELARSMPGAGAQAGVSPEQIGELDLSQVSVSISGDNAAVSAPGLSTPINMARINGKWLVSEPAIKQAAAMAPMLKPMTDAFEQIAADIESGKIASEAEVLPALMARMMPGGGAPPGGD